MSKAMKIWLIVAASLVALGLIIFGGMMSILKWNFLRLDTTKYETNTYLPDGEFSNISITERTADISFFKSNDDTCQVVCYEEAKITHSVTVENDTLNISVNDTRKWYDHISLFTVNNPMISVYLPEKEYNKLSINVRTGDVGIPSALGFENIDISTSTGDVICYASAKELIKIHTSTGDIGLENASAGAIDLSVSTGEINLSSVSCEEDIKLSVGTDDIELTDVSCKNLTSNGDTSDISLKNVIASESFNITTDTGDVEFNRCDASEIFVKADTGDVMGTLLSDKVFMANTDTGKIDVPKTAIGGRCEITTDTGDIKIHVVS